MQHTRAYSYDDQTGNQAGVYGLSHPSQYSQQYTRGYHSAQGSGQYYVQAGESINGVEPDPYYRNMAPMVSSTQHYASHGHHHHHHHRHYQSSNSGDSSSQADVSAYPTQSHYYASQYQRSHTSGVHASGGGQFIPTPSEMYNYTPRHLPATTSTSTTPHSPASTDPYSSAPYSSFVSSSRSPELRSSRMVPGRPGTSPSSPVSSSSGERFPCEKCGKTFSRSHDRKRHHETQHHTSPVIHRCRYCEKEFSRADSLKRHLDNGCDEMPS